MNNLNKNLDILDALNIVSFVIGYLNYSENLTQSDKQELLEALNSQTNILLKEINEHLEIQDNKIDKIMEVLSIETNKEVG